MRSALAGAIEASIYGVTVALVTTAALAVVVAPLWSLAALKTALFVVGWLGFGIVSIRLFSGRVDTGKTAERSRFDRTVAVFPPLRWHWREGTATASSPVVRQFAGAAAILAVSALLEFGFGVGT